MAWSATEDSLEAHTTGTHKFLKTIRLHYPDKKIFVSCESNMMTEMRVIFAACTKYQDVFFAKNSPENSNQGLGVQVHHNKKATMYMELASSLRQEMLKLHDHVLAVTNKPLFAGGVVYSREDHFLMDLLVLQMENMTSDEKGSITGKSNGLQDDLVSGLVLANHMRSLMRDGKVRFEQMKAQ